MFLSPMPSFAERLADFFAYLRRAIAAQPVAEHPAILLPRVWNFLVWTERRLQRALRRAAAGIAPKLRPPPSQPRPTRPPKSPQAVATSAFHLPRREAWLLARLPAAYHVAAYGRSLQAFLADPQVAPLLAHPPVLRLLRPLCRMLGASHCLPPAAPPRRPPPAAAAAPQAAVAPTPARRPRNPTPRPGSEQVRQIVIPPPVGMLFRIPPT